MAEPTPKPVPPPTPPPPPPAPAAKTEGVSDAVKQAYVEDQKEKHK